MTARASIVIGPGPGDLHITSAPPGAGDGRRRRQERKRRKAARKAAARKAQAAAESRDYTRWRREQQLADLERYIAQRYPAPARHPAPAPPDGALAKLAGAPGRGTSPPLMRAADPSAFRAAAAPALSAPGAVEGPAELVPGRWYPPRLEYVQGRGWVQTREARFVPDPR